MDKLAECQSLVDGLWREEKCGDDFLVSMSEVKFFHEELSEFYENERVEQSNLIQQCVSGWSHALLVYQKIYTMTSRLSSLKKSSLVEDVSPPSVPIESCSALNVVKIDELEILLYNDNESLLKYEPSQLSHLSEEIAIVEAYYEKECKEMALLLQSFQFVQEPMRMSDQQNEKRERFLRKVREMLSREECSDELREGFDQVVKDLVEVEREWVQVRVNTKIYVDNLLAKFTESVRLIHNLFRSYHLTRTKKKSNKMKSIF